MVADDLEEQRAIHNAGNFVKMIFETLMIRGWKLEVHFYNLITLRLAKTT